MDAVSSQGNMSAKGHMTLEEMARKSQRDKQNEDHYNLYNFSHIFENFHDMFTFADADNSGSITLNEFVNLLNEYNSETLERLKDLREFCFILLKEYPNERYEN